MSIDSDPAADVASFVRTAAPQDLLTLTLTPAGLYCPPAGIYIDPTRPVARALITHGHADHARSGHDAVLATAETLEIMAIRYGAGFTDARQVARIGEPIRIGDVTFTFHPAGHVLGSAQIAIERGGWRVVVSGDYKRQRDPTCLPWEPVRCDVFITEATFGLPIFRHPAAVSEANKLLASLALFPDRCHVLGAYALGKAQRMIATLREAGHDSPIYLHGALIRLTEFYAARGLPMGDTRPVTGQDKASMAGAVVLCPPSAIQDRWSRRLPDPLTAFASGWMRVRARARQRGVELPLIVSDHCDWDDLTIAIRETGAGEVWVTHGQEDALVHWCLTNGIRARPLHMLGYGDEGEAEPDMAGPVDSTGAAEAELPA
jgi:putative mRNA 3-end processing factor